MTDPMQAPPAGAPDATTPTPTNEQQDVGCPGEFVRWSAFGASYPDTVCAYSLIWPEGEHPGAVLCDADNDLRSGDVPCPAHDPEGFAEWADDPDAARRVLAREADEAPLAAVSAAAPDCGCGHPASFHTPHCYDACGCETFHTAAAPDERPVNLRADSGWLVEVHERCTCGGSGTPSPAHQPGCGLVPLVPLADIEGLNPAADLVSALREHASEALVYVGEPGYSAYSLRQESWAFNVVADWIEENGAALAARPAPVVSGADVDGLSVAIRTWHDATFPGKTNTAVALKMAEEAGEVAGAQTRCDEIADGHRTGEPTAAREHLAKELGDLAIVWLTLCARHDLAPETVVRDRWATIQNRRWTTAEPDAATPVGTKRPCARAGFEEMWDGDRWVPICLDCGDEAAYCDGTRHRTVADAPAAEPGHEFVGVAGHPDDDECTYRADGTDLTYCGLTKAEHDAPAAEAVPIPDCPAVNERRGVRCERPAGHSGRHESEECAWPFPAADDEGARA